MKRGRVIFFSSFSVLAALWSAAVFLEQSIRFEYLGLVNKIRSGEYVTNRKQLNQAIQDIGNAVQTLPCSVALHRDLGYLNAQLADLDMDTLEIAGRGDALDRMHDSLVQHLRCTPNDGKLWFDLAVIDSYRGGFNKAVQQSYLSSVHVSPNESWMAHERLGFALKFQPLLTADMKAAARKDLRVLEHAHPNRLTSLQQQAQIDSPQAFYALFDAVMPETE